MTSLKSRVEVAIEMAEVGRSQLPQSILDLEGMSSPKVRHFLNNLVATSPRQTRYLEIGCWKGSTLISALYKNETKHWAIDNFCEYQGSEVILRDRCRQHLGTEPNFFNADCFTLDLDKTGIKDVNVYFYDGWHSFGAQRQALTHFIGRMEQNFIYVVDDWGGAEGEPVRGGTFLAVQELGLEIIYERTLPAGHGQWWNGLWVAVLSRQGKEAAVARSHDANNVGAPAV
jgi:hypothetical protein